MTKQQQYIEPVGFKGTPGELEHFIQPAIKGTCDTINVGSKRVATLEFVGIEETEANAALIANAKEVIKSLMDIIAEWDSNMIEGEREEYHPPKNGMIGYWSPSRCLISSYLISAAREVIAKSIPPTK